MDAREAVKWYTRAAEAGTADAHFGLCLCLDKVKGAARGLSAAREWFSRAAAAGKARAAAEIARLSSRPAARQ